MVNLIAAYDGIHCLIIALLYFVTKALTQKIKSGSEVQREKASIQKADRDTALMKDAEESDEHKKTGESIYRNCFLTLWSDLRLEDFKWGHKTWDEL